MDTTKKIYMMVGLPGSGKSTYIQNLDNWNNNDMLFARVVSTDHIIETVANQAGMTYDEGFKLLIKFADVVFKKNIDEIISNNESFVIDRTNLTVKGRKQFIDLAKANGYEIHALVMPEIGHDEWQSRLSGRPGKTIPDTILESMVENYVYPTIEEGFTTVTFVET